jgi:4-hydroxy-4-methyl-2-oxoglutarate aldolase
VGVVTGFDLPWPGAHAAGKALTVRGAPGDNLALHRALAEAQPGEMLVADVGGGSMAAHWGGLMAVAARRCGLAGLVVNGAIRDRTELAELRFPVFFRGTSPRPPAKEVRGELRVSISIDGVHIHPEDLVVADADGVVVVPQHALDVASHARSLAAGEDELVRRLGDGESLIDLLGLTGV